MGNALFARSKLLKIGALLIAGGTVFAVGWRAGRDKEKERGLLSNHHDDFSENDPLLQLVKKHLKGEWTILSDDNRIVAVMRSVKTIGLLATSVRPENESAWKDVGSGDFIIEIKRGSLLKPEEFEKLRNLRNELLRQEILRVGPLPGSGKSIYGFKTLLNEKFPLPLWRDDYASFYWYSSDGGILATKPESAFESADAVWRALNKEFNRYLPSPPPPSEGFDPTDGFLE